MIVQIELSNIRNFLHWKEKTPTGLVCFAGQNGIGKTNILEAIALLGGKKLRNLKTYKDVIKEGENEGIVVLTYKKGEKKEVFRALISTGSITYSLDGKIVPRHILFRKVPLMTFSPETVSLFVGQPGERRRFLDDTLKTLSPEYAEALLAYFRGLRQKNILLRSNKATNLEIWEKELALHAATIFIARNWLLSELGLHMKQERTRFIYKPSPQSIKESLPQEGNLREMIIKYAGKVQELMREKYVKYREKEVALGFSLFGPQRDDWKLHYTNGAVNNADIARFGSRGQQRMAVFSLQLGMLRLLKKETGESPTWLLDDVFSELDLTHQREVLEKSAEYQTFITATEVGSVQSEISEKEGLMVHL